MSPVLGPTPAVSELPPPAEMKRAGLLTIGAGGLLVLAVIIASTPELGAPWLLGDEYVFIAGNPDVNPAADPSPPRAPLAWRLRRSCTEVHDDLYQPVPILSYALEWELSGGDPLSFRRTDVLLHALNGLLLWWVLWSLLRRVSGSHNIPVAVLAWALALLWALHPALVTTYASDMGRTHILSATFALLALRAHLHALETRRRRYFVGSVAALLAAMLCKPIVGWFLLVVVLEAAWQGWRAALASPRLYLVGCVCVTFAALTVWTSRLHGIAQDASRGLFGDPVARAALSVWLYFRDLILPVWLAFWHPPDPDTRWTHWRVWVGLALALASAMHAIRAWRHSETRLITIGWTWCWALLLPLVGLVGAREVAAVDRYLHQPLMGVFLVLGAVMIRRLAALPPVAAKRSARVILSVAGVVALAMLLWDLPQCAVARSAIRRAKRVVELNPGDPRALEALAVAYDFAQTHPLPATDLMGVPEDVGQARHFHKLWLETLAEAANCANLARYFPSPDDRGPFHRRMALRFLRAGDAAQSLSQAQAALAQQPEVFATWTRLAQAYQGLRRFEEAADAYEHAERLLPADREIRATHFTNYGYLLMFELERDSEACPKFLKALETGRAPLPAKLGLALCEIRYGDGAVGFRLVSEVLHADPTNVQAGLVLAEYHLRSHHWEQARKVYDALLRDNPTNYAALRGFHEVCFQTGHRNDAVQAWADAAHREPGRREFRSWWVWALALAGSESASAAARELLENEPNNPLACLALALAATRAGDVGAAIAWVQQARTGEPIPKARAFERAAAALQSMAAAGELPAEAVIVQAAVFLSGDFPSSLRGHVSVLLDEFLAANPESRWAELARRLRIELSDLETGR